jgi:hypothetical protein
LILFCTFQYSYANQILSNKVSKNEDCTFDCGTFWDTYTNHDIEVNRHGYHPKVGDIIAWRIKSIEGGRNSTFDGIIYYSKIMSTIDIRILINNVEQKIKTPSWYKWRCDIDLLYPVNISSGDLISVEVIAIVEDGFILSMQPSVNP